MPPPRRLAALLVTMALPLAPAAHSEPVQPSSIRGWVADADGWSPPGVTVRLGRGGTPRVEIFAETDIRGVYAIGGLQPAEDYVLSIDHPGFRSVVVGPLEVSEGATVRQDFILRSIGFETSSETSAEEQLYLDAEKRIVETIRTADTPAIGLMRALQEIENIRDEDAREELLLFTVADVLGARVEPGDPVILDLFRDPDPTIQLMAVHILFNQDTSAWLQDPELRSTLQELVELPAEDAAVVTGTLALYVYADRFDEVRPAALALARGGEVDLAWQVSSTITWSYEKDKDLAGLRQLFQESDGLLRQAAAIWLAKTPPHEFDEPLSADERYQVATELVRTMEDPSLSPEFRGEAIEAAGCLRNEPIIDDALLGLLEPEAWFFGVPGHHRARHSLAGVLESLDARPAIADDLLTLKQRLDLEEEDRREVERMIDELLSKLSSIVD